MACKIVTGGHILMMIILGHVYFIVEELIAYILVIVCMLDCLQCFEKI